MAQSAKKKKIPKETLVHLRLVEKLTIKVIAEELGCRPWDIARQLRLENIGQIEEKMSTEEKAALACDLRHWFVDERWTKTEIAARLNRSLGWVGIKLEQLKIVRPAVNIKTPAGEARIWNRVYQTPARVEKMFRFYETPKTLAETGREFGISRGYVGILFEEYGYQKRRRTATRRSRESEKKIAERRQKRFPKKLLEKLFLVEQLSVSEITRRFAVSSTTIYGYLRFYRIPLRPRILAVALKNGLPPINPETLRHQAETEEMSIRDLAEFYRRTYSGMQAMLYRLKIKAKRKYQPRK